jgi:hypothetical protein
MWAYNANQATEIENIIVQPEHQATAYELFYDGNPEWMDSLHKFGEIAIVLDQEKIWSKLKNQGFPVNLIAAIKNDYTEEFDEDEDEDYPDDENHFINVSTYGYLRC